MVRPLDDNTAETSIYPEDIEIHVRLGNRVISLNLQEALTLNAVLATMFGDTEELDNE